LSAGQTTRNEGFAPKNALNMLQQFAAGIRTWFESWRFLSRHGLLHYFLYPLAIGIIWFMGMTAFIYETVQYAWNEYGPELTVNALPNDTWWEQVLAFFAEISKYSMALLIAVLLSYTAIKISKYVILMLMSPVMSLLSERTNDILEGQTHPFRLHQFIRDVVRGSALALRNLFLEILSIWAVGLAGILITTVAPPLSLIITPLIPVISFFIGAYFFGFSTMDYTNERHRLSIRESIRKIRQLKGIAIGNGTIFALLFRIPILGATVTTITCTVAACIAMHEEKNRN
jgi:CysZ protein